MDRFLQIWQAPPEQAFDLRGYHPELEWECVWSSTCSKALIISRDGRPTESILGSVFERFQRVDENHWVPDGYEGRSLSMGDLVRLGDEWWHCEFVGWKQVSPPDSVREETSL